jgi:hypothetical protein
MRGFPAMIDGEDEEDQFLFEGESDADINVRVEIPGSRRSRCAWIRWWGNLTKEKGHGFTISIGVVQ